MKDQLRRLRKRLTGGGGAMDRFRADQLDRLMPVKDAYLDLVPDEDMIQPQYDLSGDGDYRELLVIFSTERSGSTWLCDMLLKTGYCSAHEYLQSYQYLQILNRRWGFAVDGKIDWAAFAMALRRNRTGPNGVLAINVHGSQLLHFQKLEPFLQDSPVRYVHLRRNPVEQALSYEKARSSQRWSAAFKGDADNRYTVSKAGLDGLRDALDYIVQSDLAISAFLKMRGADALTISYDGLVADPVGIVSRITGMGPDALAAVLEEQGTDALSRQSDPSRQQAEASAFAAALLDGWRPGGRIA